MRHLAALLFFVLILISCDSVKNYDPPREFQDIEKDLQTKFILAENNSVIELETGDFIFNKSLILEGKENVTIRGKGIFKTILSFKNQKDGAEGIRIANCKNITLENFSIEDAAGDNIKVTDTDGITIRKIKSAWTGVVNEKNGAYGLYPVLCRNVLVEECEVLGASDAGIYVGQSHDVIIRKNKVYWNVAGIESENSVNVKIYGNRTYENTGGILVFDLPGLTMTGENIEVYSNEVYKNNLRNFAPSGNIVGIVPPGTGMLILATRKVNVHKNQIKDNKTIGIGIISYELVDIISENPEGGISENENGSGQRINRKYEQDLNYDPYPGDIHIHDNHISSRYLFPDLRNPFGKIFLWKFGFKLPMIAWDGIKPKGYTLSDGRMNPAYQICVNEDDDVKCVILDVANDFKGLTANPEALSCD